MSPQLKRLIIIANIVVYAVVCLGIYAKRKGGFRALLPQKKLTIGEVIAKAKKEAPPTAPAVAKAPPAVEERVAPALPLPEKPLPSRPSAPKIARAGFPAHIIEARTLLEEMRIKEEASKFSYYSLNRDPFVSLIGIEGYLSQVKFTPDEYADLPFGLPIKEKQRSSPFTLFGTIKSKGGESAVIINDRVLCEGDIIDGYKVTKIERRSVKLISGKKVINLQMPKDEQEIETAILERLKEIKK